MTPSRRPYTRALAARRSTRAPLPLALGLGAAASLVLAGGLGAQEPFAGSWTGDLAVGGQALGMTFHLSADDAGVLNATLDVPIQGAVGIPTESTTVRGDTISISIPVLPGGGSYEGVLVGTDRIEGTFRQGPNALPLVLERSDGTPALERPQHPEPPFPYDVEEVAYPNPDAGFDLAGTFTTPTGQGPFPAVLLITGSGPQDRDETVAGHRIFAVLADHLTRRGIAVLRVDDRGVGESGGEFEGADSRDFASDVAAGVRWLESRPDVAPGGIGLVGHSEGGLVAPMVAAVDDGVDFLVLLAGPGVTGGEILAEQGARIAAANGASEEAVRAVRRVTEGAVAVAREAPEGARQDSLEAFFRRTYREATPQERAALGMPADPEQARAMGEQQARQMATPWMSYFLEYDPREALREVRVPVLVLNGELDLQVPHDQNVPEIERALAEGGNERVTALVLPGLNHLFQTAETGSPNEYGSISETFSPGALEIVADWILEVTGR